MFNKILYIALLLTIFIWSLSPIAVSAIDNNLKTLEDLTKSLHQSVKIQEYEKAKLLIEEIAKHITTVNFDGITSVEGIEALSLAVINTKQNLAAIEPNQEAILNSTTQLYLAVDSLIHKEQPYWHRYYSVLEEDLTNIEIAIKANDLSQIQVSTQNFQLHYNMIKPAIYVSMPAYTIEKIDSLLAALQNSKIENSEEIIAQLDESIHELFHGNDQQTWGYDMSEGIIIKSSIGIGLTIFAVLSYVIWRKFRATYI